MNEAKLSQAEISETEMGKEKVAQAEISEIEMGKEKVVQVEHYEAKKNKKKTKTLRGSIVAKIIAFFLLVISFIVGSVATMLSIVMIEGQLYTRNFDVIMKDAFEGIAYSDFWYFQDFSILESAHFMEEYCEGTNLSVEIYLDGELMWGNYDGAYTPFTYIFNTNSYTETMTEGRVSIDQMMVKLYVDADLSEDDKYRESYTQLVQLYEIRYAVPITAGVCILIFAIAFIFLMCASGHKNGKEGITPSILSWTHLDVYTIVYGIGTGFLLSLLLEFSDGITSALISIAVFGSLIVIWTTIYAMEAILRLKMGKWWKHTLVYVLLMFGIKVLTKLAKGMLYLIKGVPLIINVLIIYLGICIVECIGLILWGSGELAVVWCLEKVLLLVPVIYVALMCKKLQKGSSALAAGNLSYQVDTSKMFFDFKEHGENLNSIAEGMSVAVEQRMKSERLKTELITNVSHDIKTPLTSIINYADLIGKEVSEQNEAEQTRKQTETACVMRTNETLQEYAEVLLRQSKRLKKLLDDLVEASKATTGNLEVSLEPCQVEVLLSQAVGEYEKRFEEKQLELLTRWPEESVKIMADGRHMWRVFDNLLNNICKYAQEGSRVYLTLEVKGQRAEIIFRNMSKYALDVSAEELQERFVRGDKSRHMEGNGLGLSIAKSLVELQKGEMEIVTDGDLFKVIIGFSIL